MRWGAPAVSLARNILRTWGTGLAWFFAAAAFIVLLSHVPQGLVQVPRTLPPSKDATAASGPGEIYMHQPIDLLEVLPQYAWNTDRYIGAVGRYVAGLFHDDLAYREQTGARVTEHPVLPLIAESLGRSFWLFAGALAGGFPFGLLLGALGVHWRWLRLPSLTFTMGGLSVPDYYLVMFGQVATVWCYRHLGVRLWSVGVPGGERQWVLPVLSLGIPVAALVGRLANATLDEIMREDYVRTARAMGIPEWRVILLHVMRNALPRILVSLPALVNMSLSSLVIVELLTSWAGLGQYLIPGAATTQSVLLATGALVFCAWFTLFNCLAHTLRLLANPRLQEVAA